MPIEFDLPDNLVGRTIEEGIARYQAGIALETTRVLTRLSDNVWPHGNRPTSTGNSVRKWIAEEGNAEILVVNTAPYVKYVNNEPVFPSGKRNPNYRAAQRQVEANADVIQRKALEDV